MEYFDNDIWLKNSATLRRLIGVFGMALPLLLFVFLYLDSGLEHPLDSISHYYYTRVTSVFTSVLTLIAIFLIVYKGKKSVDFYLSFFAGFFALMVAFFPTGNITDICGDTTKTYSVTVLRASHLRELLHYISAALFFIILAYMAIFLFTKSNKSVAMRGSKKIARNRIYRVCGVLMVAAILVICAGMFGIIPEDVYVKYHLTYWMETLAIESFGFSWLIKGDTLFKDEEPEAKVAA